MIPWKQHHARRYSRDATAKHQRWMWAWVANSWRLRGYDDDRCIREACGAVTACLALKHDAAAYTGRYVGNRKTGPRPITTARIPSIYRARHALRQAAEAARKGPPRPRGE
jgi:hypothetical protein